MLSGCCAIEARFRGWFAGVFSTLVQCRSRRAAGKWLESNIELGGAASSIRVHLAPVGGVADCRFSPPRRPFARTLERGARYRRTAAARTVAEICCRLALSRHVGISSRRSHRDSAWPEHRLVSPRGVSRQSAGSDSSPDLAVGLDSARDPLVWRWRFSRDLSYLCGVLFPPTAYGHQRGS